jgi:hypothetical protein
VQGIQADPENVEQIRERIRKMSEAELLRYGSMAKHICGPVRSVTARSLFGRVLLCNWDSAVRTARELLS